MQCCPDGGQPDADMVWDVEREHLLLHDISPRGQIIRSLFKEMECSRAILKTDKESRETGFTYVFWPVQFNR